MDDGKVVCGVVYDNGLVLASCGKFRPIMRKFNIPNFVSMLVELNSGVAWKCVSVTDMIAIQRRHLCGVVVEALVDLVLLHVVQKDGKAVVWDHHCGGYESCAG